MTIDDYMSHLGIKSLEELSEYFRKNIRTGRLPVALAWCPECREIIWDYHKPGHKCKEDK